MGNLASPNIKHVRRPRAIILFDVEHCPLLRKWERQGIEWARRHPELVGAR
jgi:hypothetical protein